MDNLEKQALDAVRKSHEQRKSKGVVDIHIFDRRRSFVGGELITVGFYDQPEDVEDRILWVNYVYAIDHDLRVGGLDAKPDGHLGGVAILVRRGVRLGVVVVGVDVPL